MSVLGTHSLEVLMDPWWLDRQAYPFRSRGLDLAAGRMHYVDEGAGAPLVLVHGNPTWSFLYRHAIRRFAGEHRCVAMDHLGFGLSDSPRRPLRPAQHAQNLGRLVEALDLRAVTLVVHDWGAPIGLDYATRHPANVRGLVVLNGWAWPAEGERRLALFSRLAGAAPARFLARRLNLLARYGMKRLYADPSRLTPAIHRHYIRAMSTPGDRAAAAWLPREITASGGWLGRIRDRLDVLRDTPAAIVWGMADPAFREAELARWTEALPGAEVDRLEGVGHYVQEEAPDRLNDAIERVLVRSS